KQQVHEVMQELLYSLNYMWFLMEGWIGKNCPEKLDTEEFKQLGETFGSYEAKRLEKTVDPETKGLDRLEAFLKRSHWCAFEDIEITRLSETELRMRTLNCTAQKAARKWGMEFYECGDAGLRLRRGFFTRINPKAEVRRIYTPAEARPEELPKEVSCEWIISI
ncbi:MAG: DUF6125 family protein, partial [Desulfobacterales bacterium]